MDCKTNLSDKKCEEKALLRNAMRAKRAELDDARQALDSKAVFRRICELEIYKNAQIIMAYVAVRGELSLYNLIEDVFASRRKLLLPRCEPRGLMTARLVHSMNELIPGAYGIREPARESEMFPPECIDLILVPGTAFDRAGGRIGQGGGYYDRFLPQTQALRVGVCHDFALFERLPQADNDVRMDMVVTPGGIAVPDQTPDADAHV